MKPNSTTSKLVFVLQTTGPFLRQLAKFIEALRRQELRFSGYGALERNYRLRFSH